MYIQNLISIIANATPAQSLSRNTAKNLYSTRMDLAYLTR
jgi:hypothetical protein